MTSYQVFHSDTKTPSPLAPSGACDSQIHVFDSIEKRPPRAGAAYITPSATIDAALKMHRTLGIERGMIVQSTAYGHDHVVLLEALERAGPGYKGCAVIGEDTTDAEMQRLTDQGVCGARFNFNKNLNLVPDDKWFASTIARLRAYGWHVKIHARGDELVRLKPLLDKVDIPAVIDHFGIFEITEGLGQPAMLAACDLLQKGNWWMMLSAMDRRSQTGYPWNDTVPFARRYIEVAPDRVIWGSNWPHPLITQEMVMPNDGDLMELAYRYAGTPEMQQKLLVTNPARLFGFD